MRSVRAIGAAALALLGLAVAATPASAQDSGDEVIGNVDISFGVGEVDDHG